MSEFGLIGKNLKYSLSKKIHESYGLYDYDLFEIEEEGLASFMKDMKEGKGPKGINVTIPYKRKVRAFLDGETAIAKRIGAVNTVYMREGKLIGDNTDFYGFLHTLNLLGAKTNGKKVLILGRGGAAKCVREAMKERHAGLIWQTHRHELKDLSKMSDAEIIVNATPIGTAKTPLEGKKPCELKQFKNLELVIDLVYNPEKTPLLHEAESLGIRAIGGMEMLKFQAEKSAHRFMSTKNIVLIGMPGAGKSHIARVLAAKTGRQFIDTDLLVKEKTGFYPDAVIKNSGEKEFRKIESEVLRNAAENENAVISTGGGIVTVKENKELLKGSLVVWIQRDLDLLPRDHRPLSKDIYKLYEEREALYEAFSDIAFSNNESPENCVSMIKKVCKI